MDKRGKFQRRDERNKKEGDTKMKEKKCPFCNGVLRYRGPKNGVGTVYWKCKNKCCGRTVDVRSEPPKEVIPLVYVEKYRGSNDRR